MTYGPYKGERNREGASRFSPSSQKTFQRSRPMMGGSSQRGSVNGPSLHGVFSIGVPSCQ